MDDKELECMNQIKLMLTSCDNFFGISRKDEEYIQDLISAAERNVQPSKFPDFISKVGILEHYSITSSEEKIRKGKGSKHQEELSLYKKRVNNALQKDEKNGFLSLSHKFCVHSYSNLVSSIKKNTEKHIQSLERYTGSKKTVIFIIEYSDFALEMFEEKWNKFDKIKYGDYPRNEIISDYRLSRDKKTLSYFYDNYLEKIDYIIFKNSLGVEFIKLSNIPAMISVLSFDFMISSKGGLMRVDSFVKIGSVESNKL